MKGLLLIITLARAVDSFSQYRSQVDQYAFAQPALMMSKKSFIPGLRSDPMRNYRMPAPIMLGSSSNDWRMQNNFFWTGNITTMSYNKGKFGTYFYWDVQGNLRGTRGFIDISGKNKRGLKLTFLWRSIVTNKF